MIRTFSLYALAMLLSLSILGPSFLALLNTDADIEVVQDIEEEKEETKKELEEYKKFLNELPSFSIKVTDNRDLSSHYYLIKTYGHIKDIHSPPPDYI
jgi:hypothetical protein